MREDMDDIVRGVLALTPNDVLDPKKLAATIFSRLHLSDGYAFLKSKITGSHVAIMMYHRVTIRKDEWSLVSTLAPERFESEIRYLCEHFSILSLEELCQYLQQDESLPIKAAAITFDDGYKDNYLCAFPILRRYRVPATFFLTTGHIGTSSLFWWDTVGYLVHHAEISRLQLDELGTYRLETVSDRSRANSEIINRLNCLSEDRKNDLIEQLADICKAKIPAELGSQLILSWDEVREMSRDGAQFGAHSVTHPNLTSLPLEQARSEILESKKAIEKKLEKAVHFFAYPGGSFNLEMARVVQQSGYVAATSIEPSWVTRGCDLFRLPRIGMREDPDISAVLRSGFWGDMQSIVKHWSPQKGHE
jgi:peptidoglycan/xylan/chitin deacetylase (PgdA/CDA1 family)